MHRALSKKFEWGNNQDKVEKGVDAVVRDERLAEDLRRRDRVGPLAMDGQDLGPLPTVGQEQRGEKQKGSCSRIAAAATNRAKESLFFIRFIHKVIFIRSSPSQGERPPASRPGCNTEESW